MSKQVQTPVSAGAGMEEKEDVELIVFSHCDKRLRKKTTPGSKGLFVSQFHIDWEVTVTGA